MKAIYSMIAAAALALVQPTPASAGVNDPEIIIYRFPGVLDNGGAFNAGVATVFHCTNFSGENEIVRFVVRNFDGQIMANSAVTIGHLRTRTQSTHNTNAYFDEVLNNGLGTGLVNQGTTAIAATSINVICTAMTIDASTVAPVGAALRGIRFAPVPGSQE
jgi:hypothetical protein